MYTLSGWICELSISLSHNNTLIRQCHWYVEVSISCIFCGIFTYMHQFDLHQWIITNTIINQITNAGLIIVIIFVLLLHQKLNTYIIRNANVTLVLTGCRIIRHGDHWRSIWHCIFFHGSMESKSWVMSNKLFWWFFTMICKAVINHVKEMIFI